MEERDARCVMPHVQCCSGEIKWGARAAVCNKNQLFRQKNEEEEEEAHKEKKRWLSMQSTMWYSFSFFDHLYFFFLSLSLVLSGRYLLNINASRLEVRATRFILFPFWLEEEEEAKKKKERRKNFFSALRLGNNRLGHRERKRERERDPTGSHSTPGLFLPQ